MTSSEKPEDYKESGLGEVWSEQVTGLLGEASHLIRQPYSQPQLFQGPISWVLLSVTWRRFSMAYLTNTW